MSSRWSESTNGTCRCVRISLLIMRFFLKLSLVPQEEKDREYAAKLATEFQAMSMQQQQQPAPPAAPAPLSAPAPVAPSIAPNPLAAYPGFQAPPQQTQTQPTVGSSGIVYGAPVATPPVQYGYASQYPGAGAGAAPSAYGASSGAYVPGSGGPAQNRPAASVGGYSTMAFQPPATQAPAAAAAPQSAQGYYLQQYGAGPQAPGTAPPPLPPKPQTAPPAAMPYSYGGVPYSAAPVTAAPAPPAGVTAQSQQQPTAGSMDNKVGNIAPILPANLSSHSFIILFRRCGLQKWAFPTPMP
jgi:hypothetical protein